MSKSAWTPFPDPQPAFDYQGEALAENWHRLHCGDMEPFPDAEWVEAMLEEAPDVEEWAEEQGLSPETIAERLQEAWRAFHRGDFQEACETGIALGALGSTVANKAAGIYATYLEEDEDRALELFSEAAKRGEAAINSFPEYANAHYFHAFVLGRYSQGISIVKALAQGLGGKIKDSLTTTLELEPEHSEAHTAMALYHAEIIDKVGSMVGGLTYGASKDKSLHHFKEAVELHPDGAIAKLEYGNGLILLFGKKKAREAQEHYAEAADSEPADAMEYLDAAEAAEHLD